MEKSFLLLVGQGSCLLMVLQTSRLIYWRHPSILSAAAGRPAAPSRTLIHFCFTQIDKIQAERINQPGFCWSLWFIDHILIVVPLGVFPKQDLFLHRLHLRPSDIFY